MAQDSQIQSQAASAAPDGVHPLAALETALPALNALLQDNDVAPVAPTCSTDYENRLVEVRLGIASSLFAAIRHKHAATAAHSLRVALACSSWASALGMKQEQRDELEVAALLHDIGKIGAPDRLLFKPGALARDEVKQVDQYRRTGLSILTNCCDSPGVLEIIRHSGGWYNGTRSEYTLVGEEIPLGARILAIVDAFDSMTSDQVYRRAMPRERALNELFRNAGVQFDPGLVRSFAAMQFSVQQHRKVVSHWLQTLDAAQSNRFWRGVQMPTPPGAIADLHTATLFQRKLLENMYDAVIFVDSSLQISLWNRAAERLTGIPASSVLERTWSPTLLGMRDEGVGGWVHCDCPVANAMNSGVQSLRRALVANRNNEPVAVDVHTVPVVGPDGLTHGAAMILHDASGEASLEERCQTLQEQASKDPLTDVANRAEFDRAHQLFVNAHLERGVPCSMIICDLDHFKSINDTYGHQAGDEVLKNFGRLLKSECRAGDLVARYGGEEFVVLCADCTAAAAANRAEEIRKTMGQLAHGVLNGKHVTVSIGVTEIQAGDTADSMLRRADRALLEAKRLGRNMVVQLGTGLTQSEATAEEASLKFRYGSELFIERTLMTAVPLNIALEKLRGFVLDHHAEVLSINADRIDLRIEALNNNPARRRSDRPIPFLVELALAEQRAVSTSVDGRVTGELSRTQVNVAIRLKRARDRRNADVAEQASAILAGIKSYLMATDETHATEDGKPRRAMNVLAPWLKLRR